MKKKFIFAGILLYLIAGCSGGNKSPVPDGSGSSGSSSLYSVSSAASASFLSSTLKLSNTEPAIPAYSVIYIAPNIKEGKAPADFNKYMNGAAVTVMDNTGGLVNKGSTFAGWNTRADGNGTSYAAGTVFEMDHADVTFYTIWLPDSLTFSSSGKNITIEGHSASFAGVLVIPGGVTRIGWNSFLNCSGLSGVKIPGTVESIGDSAFDGCTNLTGIIIPASVVSIGDYAFYKCVNLTDVTLNAATPPALEPGSKAFHFCNQALEIHVPSASGGLYRESKGWSDYSSMIVSP